MVNYVVNIIIYIYIKQVNSKVVSQNLLVPVLFHWWDFPVNKNHHGRLPVFLMGASFCTSRRPALAPDAPMSDAGLADGRAVQGEGSAGASVVKFPKSEWSGGFHKWESWFIMENLWKSYCNGWFWGYPHFRKPPSQVNWHNKMIRWNKDCGFLTKWSMMNETHRSYLQ